MNPEQRLTFALALVISVCCTGPPNTTRRQSAGSSPPGPSTVHVAAVPSRNWGTGFVVIDWPPIAGARSYTIYRSRFPADRVSCQDDKYPPADSEDTEEQVAVVSRGLTEYTDRVTPLGVWIRYAVSATTASGTTARATSAWVQPIAASDARVWGFADTHTHLFANLAFGGDLFWGSPFGDEESALRKCYLGHGLTFGVPLHRRSGYNTYDGWPSWNTQIHQQMYSNWLYRAFQGGLRLMVMLAVNSELLCRAAHGTEAKCKDWESVPSQLQSARDMESYLARHGSAWFHVVASAAEARATINRGQLAVVLGIEADEVFDCRRPHSCTEAEIRATLQRYYKLGVRHFFPIHLADNQFGGMALFPARANFNFVNKFMNSKWLSVESCAEVGIEFDMNRAGGSSIANAFGLTHHLGYFGRPPQYAVRPGHCNSQGLTPMGRFLMRELFAQGFIVDVDHMSRKAVDEALTIAEEMQEPVIAGHTTVLGALRGQRRSEYAKSDEQLRRISAVNGMVSIGLAEVPLANELTQTNALPKNNCSSSSAAWAQPYLYAVSRLGGADTAVVGVATDQAFINLVGPRFGPDACNGGARAERADQGTSGRLSYPIPILSPGRPLQVNASRQGTRTFDFNTDGMAHIGMYPDFFADLLTIGVTAGDLQPVFRSAERYIRVWQSVERHGPQNQR